MSLAVEIDKMSMISNFKETDIQEFFRTCQSKYQEKRAKKLKKELEEFSKKNKNLQKDPFIEEVLKRLGLETYINAFVEFEITGATLENLDSQFVENILPVPEHKECFLKWLEEYQRNATINQLSLLQKKSKSNGQSAEDEDHVSEGSKHETLNKNVEDRDSLAESRRKIENVSITNDILKPSYIIRKITCTAFVVKLLFLLLCISLPNISHLFVVNILFFSHLEFVDCHWKIGNMLEL
ncbi:hypothetical protein RFI_27911 [Reticulomyxa filosa]|uniref:SAM domain-containing protein n=1 Tax=Reticulomyxa filosa TaxID=46433 RepID=X6M769_RETFI|nr:hypothetical protein RFI_27911 [Reticulomyxa filosa]|eukprot:ETO09466.1 hypothetical protein RFI_27911 [Reticulomyxa filosa]